MKLFRKIAIITASLLLAMPISGCSESENESSSISGADSQSSSDASKEQNTAIVPDAETVKLLGRTYLDDNNTLWLSYSGSGAEFTVTGKRAEITIAGDSSVSGGSNYARIAIYVDGERVVDDMVDNAEEKYLLFEGEEEKTATISIVKLSECAMSSCGIAKIDVDGTVSPTPEKDLYIEFIGDSITCGYGVDDEDKSHSFSTTTEDVTKAYAYKTAQKLSADYSMVSISGYGVVSGYTTSGEKVSAQTIPQYYDKLGFSYNNFNGTKPEDIEWSFADNRKPDIIVLNLGTNDSSYCGGSIEKSEEFAQGYIDFIKQIRENNPDASIVCAFGVMGNSLYQYIEYACVLYTEETGDDNVYYVQLAPQDGSLGYAADWHPTEATHEVAAQTVVDFINENVLG